MEVIIMPRVHPIKVVEKGSIAEELDVQPGDVLLKINGSPVEDVLEYRFLINDDYIEVLIRKASGEEWLLEIQKEPMRTWDWSLKRGLWTGAKAAQTSVFSALLTSCQRG
jgi:NifB/MoaA-like Fe-S oxidoreductase